MKTDRSALLVLFLVFFVGTSSVCAQGRGEPPSRPDTVPPPFDDMTSLVPGACNSCGTRMSGEWTYTVHDSTGTPTMIEVPITFAQFGAYFWGNSATHMIIGEVRGKWIRLTMTVYGEEGLGWVRKAEGSVHAYPEYGGFTLGTMVSEDSTGGSGSIILRRPPS